MAAVVSRAWIAITIVNWIPTDVITDRNIDYKCHEGGTPPTAPLVILTARRPGPVAIVINPASEVIRRPTPWFCANPGPSIRRDPGPVAIPVRRPVGVSTDHRSVGPPDPSVLVCLHPGAIRVEVFRPPDVVIVITPVITHSLDQMLI